MALRPPQHRADAPIVYVHRMDEAWDKEAIEADAKRMKEVGEDPSQHPYALYTGGHTRYDLDAPGTVCGEIRTPRDYLDETKKPTKWKLRRLNWDEWYEVDALWQSDVRLKRPPHSAFLKALSVGVKEVEDGPELAGPPNRLTRDDIEQLYEMRLMINDEVIDPALDIGEAVYTASMPMTEAEGKR